MNGERLESIYIVATNLARCRTAQSILRDMCTATSAETRERTKALCAIARLEHQLVEKWERFEAEAVSDAR